jgi:hypothetical protein
MSPLCGRSCRGGSDCKDTSLYGHKTRTFGGSNNQQLPRRAAVMLNRQCAPGSSCAGSNTVAPHRARRSVCSEDRSLDGCPPIRKRRNAARLAGFLGDCRDSRVTNSRAYSQSRSGLPNTATKTPRGQSKSAGRTTCTSDRRILSRR